MSNENDAFKYLKNLFEEQEQERRIQAEEAQIRYAERRNQKIEHRRRIEAAAMQICSMVTTATESARAERKPEEITALAAALAHAATAMHAAENYAESRPFYGGMMGGYCSA